MLFRSPAAGGVEGTEAAGVGDAAVDAGLSAGRKEAEPAAVSVADQFKTLTDEQLEAIVDSTFLENEESRAAKAELARRKGAAGAVETKETKPAAPKSSTASAKTVEELEAEADAVDAAYKQKITDAEDMGRRMAQTAFDTRREYDSLEESIGS